MATYLITGATGGIGSVVCDWLAKSGHRIILAARNKSNLSALSQQLDIGSPTPHVALQLDITSIPSVHAFAARLKELYIELDGAIVMPPATAQGK